jgi:hypothetical protein
VDGEYGRIEERCYWLVSELGWLAEKKEWAGLRSLGLGEHKRTVDGATTVEEHYCLTSPAGDAEQFGHAERLCLHATERLNVVDRKYRSDDTA